MTMMMLEDTECRVLLEQRWYWLTQSTLFTNSVSGLTDNITEVIGVNDFLISMSSRLM